MTDKAKAEIEWHKVKAKKGWTVETEAMIVYEFIKAKGLFADLLAHVRRK
jgi:hypothetical protein